MSITRTLGGDRLGAGKKNFVTMRSYDRSTHDLSYIWRSTMAPGTLVPFMSKVALPGDTFDIDLNCEIMTHPTVGPLFGSYKVQLDVFSIPIRLYNGKLHNNTLGIGNKMSEIELPQLYMYADWNNPADGENVDNTQINPSCIFAYLGIRGLGRHNDTAEIVEREFNAVPFLGYWDIYKNYYANKQEEIGAVIHNTITPGVQNIVSVEGGLGSPTGTVIPQAPTITAFVVNNTLEMTITTSSATVPDWTQILLTTNLGLKSIAELFTTITATLPTEYELTGYTGAPNQIDNWKYATSGDLGDQQPQVVTFNLDGIDTMRETILAQSLTASGGYQINSGSTAPYGLPFASIGSGPTIWSKMTNLEGLALKTYQSDLFNNWIQTEWIDGVDGISAVTAISTAGGSFTIDTLNISKKVYDMLNRIALSGGSYKDWIDTVYTETDSWIAETPMYMGGLIKELVFQEVISNSQTPEQPLGTLGGRGVMAKKHKGGKITVKVKEPSYIMGIVSLTPRLDYSQGNDWDVNLKTMDDFHKPALDEIGFQDLITDQMAWWDTNLTTTVPVFNSAGKQPAWLNYMTSVNVVRGNFAVEGNEMFMTLNRKYEIDGSTYNIKDLTTYIDPIKFNDIFAETSRDAQNFWTQIGVDITARRIMSAKLIPNL